MWEIIGYILLFAVSVAGLIWAAGIAIKQLEKIACILKFSEFIAAFLLMAFATTIPELFVGLTSAFNGAAELSVGDSIGSDIADLTLVAGLIILFGRGLPAKSKLVKKDIIINLGIAILPLLLGADGNLSRFDGVILLIVYGLYVWFQAKIKSRFTNTVCAIREKGFWKAILKFVFAVAILLVSSSLLVNSAVFMAETFNMPEIFIGMTLIALGTSIPELSFGIRALRQNHPDMVMGDLIGAFAANAAFILGLVVVISPVVMSNMPIFLLGAASLPIVVSIFLFFASTKERISWRESIALILLYVLFIYLQTLFK